MTRPCVNMLSPLQRTTVRLLDATMVKDQLDSVEIYRAIGESENETAVVPASAKPTEAGGALVDRNDNEQFLRRESALLTVNGVISVGAPPKDNPCGLIQYWNEGCPAREAADSIQR